MVFGVFDGCDGFDLVVEVVGYLVGGVDVVVWFVFVFEVEDM